MPRSQKILFIAGLGTLLFAIACSFWMRSDSRRQWQTLNRENLSSPDAGWLSSSDKDRVSGKTRQRQIDDRYRQIAARHPDLALPWRNVPDEQNGYLQWLEFENQHPNGLELPDDILALLHDPGKWDAQRAAQWLDENKALLDEITRIGQLPDQSSHGVDPPKRGIVNVQLAKHCVGLLGLQARLLASQGDTETAAHALQSAQGLANHFDQHETSCALDLTVSTVLRQTASTQFFTQILPLLPSNADLSLWQQATGASSVPADYAATLRGEWHTLTQMILLNETNGPSEILDNPERLIDAFGKYTKQRMDACTSAANWEHLQSACHAIMPDPTGLSANDTRMLEGMKSASDEYTQGVLHTQYYHNLNAAAFAHLRGEPLPNEPITGLPYIWDAATNTLSPPADPRLNDLQLKPIKLPR